MCDRCKDDRPSRDATDYVATGGEFLKCKDNNWVKISDIKRIFINDVVFEKKYIVAVSVTGSGNLGVVEFKDKCDAIELIEDMLGEYNFDG